jgi:hypothetical protein
VATPPVGIESLSAALDGNERILAASYSRESAFLLLEASTASDARTLAEAIVREALPDHGPIDARLVYDDEGNIQ